MAGTLSITEDKSSRSLMRSYGLSGNSLELVLNVRWVPANSSDTFPGWAWMESQAGFPQARTRIPSAAHEGDAYLKRFVIRRVKSVTRDDATYCAKVVAECSTLLPRVNGPWMRVARGKGFRTVSAWRLGAMSFPTDGTIAWPPTADIAGDRVDVNGAPRAHELGQQSIIVETLWDRTLVVGGSPQGDPKSDTFRDFVNTRNSQPMWDYPKGMLLYKGFTVQPEDELYLISHEWVADPWYWLDQFAVPNKSGQLYLDGTVTAIGMAILNAGKVGWIQRFPMADSRDVFADSAEYTAVLAQFNSAVPEAL